MGRRKSYKFQKIVRILNCCRSYHCNFGILFMCAMRGESGYAKKFGQSGKCGINIENWNLGVGFGIYNIIGILILLY